jgi:photosystem II stability/assembly factor-like uncharacterized protein
MKRLRGWFALLLLFVAPLAAAQPANQDKLAAQRLTPVLINLTLLAGGPSGLWRSTDWGVTWKKAEKTEEKGEDPATIVGVSAILPIGPAVYVASESGAFASDDFGQTWTRWPLEAQPLSLLPSRYPLADLTVFVGTPEGLLVSPDLGRTFKPTRLRGLAVEKMQWPGPALVVGTSAGVAISRDEGETWAPPGVGLPPGPVGALALSSYYANDPLLFAGVASRGVQGSRDGGATWSSAGLDGKRVIELVWLGPFLYALTDQGLFRSQDVAESWSAIGKGLEGKPQALLFPLAPANGAEVFVATSRGVFRSLDGAESFVPIAVLEDDFSVLATFPQSELLKKKK